MIWLYRLLMLLLSPLIDLWFGWRILIGKEAKGRLKERLGQPSQPRPSGPLVWFHGASVGETLSLLPLLSALREQAPELTLLVTSGTVTSARLMAERLPVGIIHQMIPLDYGLAVNMFMRHWQPTVSVFVESEFWPELLWQAPHPIIINARLSARSAERFACTDWFWQPFWHRLKAAYAQTEADASRLQGLGIRHVTTAGNLKYDAPPPPANPAQLDDLKHTIGDRPVLLAASTHAPEEEHIADIHSAIGASYQVSRLLTIIVPRHPHRGPAIAAALARRGHKVACRSKGGALTPETQFYIADTLGELGLWYRLADVVIIGGSFIPHGGQNPLEALKCGKPALSGPHMENFAGMVPILTRHDVLHVCADVPEAIERAGTLLANPASAAALAGHIPATLSQLTGASGTLCHAILSHVNQQRRMTS